MTNETMKIARACAIGGVICVAVALAVAPVLWWLGLIAGFASGYLAYEFREVLAAVPIVARFAWRGTSAGFRATVAFAVRVVIGIGDAVVTALHWFQQREHPFLFLGALTFAAWMYVTGDCWMATGHLPLLPTSEMGTPGWLLANTVLFSVVFAIPTFGLLALFALIGCQVVEHRYWEPSLFLNEKTSILRTDGEIGVVTRREELELLGYRPAPLTYWNLARWIIEGAVAIPYLAVRRLFRAVGEALRFAGRFVRFFILAIHSSERLLCGVDGMLGGGIVAMWAVQQPELAVSHAIVAIAFGGILGATFGVLNYRLVSPRLARYPVRF